MPRPDAIEFKLTIDKVETLVKGLKELCRTCGDESEHDEAVAVIDILEKKISRAYRAKGYHKCSACGEYHKPLGKKEPGQENPGSVED